MEEKLDNNFKIIKKNFVSKPYKHKRKLRYFPSFYYLSMLSC